MCAYMSASCDADNKVPVCKLYIVNDILTVGPHQV
jgi:hypothetical protein